MSDWHPEDIKAAIRKRGISLAALAADHNISKQTLSLCLSSRASERGDLIIADFLGLKPRTIWPSRYHTDGTRIRLQSLSAAERAAA